MYVLPLISVDFCFLAMVSSRVSFNGFNIYFGIFHFFEKNIHKCFRDFLLILPLARIHEVRGVPSFKEPLGIGVKKAYLSTERVSNSKPRVSVGFSIHSATRPGIKVSSSGTNSNFEGAQT